MVRHIDMPNLQQQHAHPTSTKFQFAHLPIDQAVHSNQAVIPALGLPRPPPTGAYHHLHPLPTTSPAKERAMEINFRNSVVP